MEDKKLTDTYSKFQNDMMKLVDALNLVNEGAHELYNRSLNKNLYRSDFDVEVLKKMASELGIVVCHNKDLRLILSEMLGHVTPELRKKYVERLKCLEDEYEKRAGNKTYLAYI